MFFLMASFVGARPDSFSVAEGDVFPVLNAHFGVI
jgi:hypothetical protein